MANAYAEAFLDSVLYRVTSPTPQEPQSSSISPKGKENEKPSHDKGFFPSTIDELKLVVWPSRQQLFSESIAVILMVTLSAASIAAISRFYGWGASHIFR